MGTIIQTELQKLKRRKLVWGILVLTTLIALFAFERACSISRKSAIMDSFGDYYTLALLSRSKRLQQSIFRLCLEYSQHHCFSMNIRTTR